MPRGRAPRELPGKLIAVEGLDGSGKSTQIYLVKRWLELEGYKVFFTEWNSSLLVKRSTKKGKKRHLLTPTTFALIHCTDFADRYETTLQLRPSPGRHVPFRCATHRGPQTYQHRTLRAQIL